MIRRTVLAAALVTGVLASAAPAVAADGPTACPTEDFVLGAGWGADRGSRSHLGIDMGGRRGTPIYAVEDGVIDRTKRQSNGALQIVMRGASGPLYYYGHMDEVTIRGGDRVAAGDVIGRMGDSGSPGAVHLHFEFWKSGGESDAVDPEPLVRQLCRIDGDRGGDQRISELQPATKKQAPRPKRPRPAQDRPADRSVIGEVFENS